MEISDKVVADLLQALKAFCDALEGAAPRRSGPPPKVQRTIPNCPKCGQRMLLRTRKGDGGQFWGCSGFPECRGIISIDQFVNKKPSASQPEIPLESDDVPF